MRSVDDELLLSGVGRRIAERRVAKKLTQDEVAENAGVSLKYLQRVEAGGENLTLVSLAKFAKLFEVPIQSLFRKPRKLSSRRGRPPAGAVVKSGKAPSRRAQGVRPSK